MKKTPKVLSTLLLIACSSITQAATEGASAKDFLSMSRADLPPVQVLVKAALDSSKIEKTSLSEMKRNARRSAALPSIRLRLDYDLDAVANREFVENSRVVGNGQTVDRFVSNGFDDRMSYGIFAEWDLSTFVWERQDNQLAERYARQGGLERRRIIDVSSRYAKLRLLLPADSSGYVEDADIAAVLEYAIYLDAVSGNALSRSLQNNAKITTTGK